MILEIVYSFKRDKDSDTELGYTYLRTTQTEFNATCVSEANKHFKKFATSLGSRKCKLKTIQVIQNEKTPAPVRAIDPPKPKRTPRSTRTSKARKPSPSSQTKIS